MTNKGQATTEVVLLFPLFFVLALFIMKIYGLLVVVQKAEIAAFYAAKRWQLESHKASQYLQWDKNYLLKDISKKVEEYMGLKDYSMKKFLALRSVKVDVERTNVWQVVTLTISTYPPNIRLLCSYNANDICQYPYGQACFRGYNFLCKDGGTVEVRKNVPSRDRPVSFVLPNSLK